MSSEGRLLAVQLANQQLADTQRQMQEELAELRTENQRLLTENRRLQRALAQAETHRKTLEKEYEKARGQRFQGKASTTKFGFSSTV